MDKSPYWQVRRGQEVLAHGLKETMPSKEQRQSMRNSGLKIYVDGKIFREKVNDHDSR